MHIKGTIAYLHRDANVFVIIKYTWGVYIPIYNGYLTCGSLREVVSFIIGAHVSVYYSHSYHVYAYIFYCVNGQGWFVAHRPPALTYSSCNS